MNISEFFIKKPVFCTVLISFIIIIGFLSLNKIPLRQFPDIERSEISIDTIYPGAASNIVETKITEIIEAQISGNRINEWYTTMQVTRITQGKGS